MSSRSPVPERSGNSGDAEHPVRPRPRYPVRHGMFLAMLGLAACGGDGRARIPNAGGGGARDSAAGSGDANGPSDGGAAADLDVGLDHRDANTGLPDAGATDTGPSPDVSSTSDTGPMPDASSTADTGPMPDASSTADTGPTAPSPIALTLTYSDGTTRSFEACYLCDSTPDDGGGHAMLRFQVGSGHTVFAIFIPRTATAGSQTLVPGYSGAYLTLAETDSGVAASHRGTYLATGQSGLLDLSRAELRPGGTVAGIVDARMTHPLNAGVYVDIAATFEVRL
ncbi:MAG: hypothetical protein IT384_04730 [Deltaproteobacteria bacterium]|nr:hypothetical protein [Deltaproteobacteria bacterium]